MLHMYSGIVFGVARVALLYDAVLRINTGIMQYNVDFIPFLQDSKGQVLYTSGQLGMVGKVYLQCVGSILLLTRIS